MRYNMACALALSGRVGDARAHVNDLVQCGAVTVEDVQADADLAGV